MRSVWVDPELQTFPALDRDLEVDVAIIGAGFSGLGAAWALRDSGATVVVVESRTVASGASGRNAGFLLAGSAEGFVAAAKRVGAERTSEIWQFTQENNRLLAEIISTCRIDCGFLRRGSMSLAADETEWDELRSEQQQAAAAGIEACLVSRAELPRPFDERYFGGVYWAGNGEFDPGRFLRALAALLPVGSVRERTPVTQLRPGRTWQLSTPLAAINAHSVILATNAWTPSLLTGLPIVPTRGQVLASRPLKRVVVPFPLYARRGFEYWRQTPEGRLIAGGWRDLDIKGEVGTDERLHRGIQRELDDFARFATGEVVVDYRWAGIMGFTPDHMPLVGPIPGAERLYTAAGYSGHGVSLAFNCGRRVAQQAIGLPATIPAPFGPARFPAMRFA